MKKNIIILVLFCMSLFMIGGGVLYLLSYEDEKTLLPKNSYKLANERMIDICINPEGCLNMGTDIYASIVYDFNNKDIQETLKKINKETDMLYQKAINSDMTAPECQEYTSMYEHRYRSNMLYYSYTGDDFISFFIQRMNQDLCMNTSEEYQYEFYYYDVNKREFLTEQEVMEKENVSEEDINEVITESVKSLSEVTKKTYNLSNATSDYHLYYSNEGDLTVSYYLSEQNAVFTAIVKEKK